MTERPAPEHGILEPENLFTGNGSRRPEGGLPTGWSGEGFLESPSIEVSPGLEYHLSVNARCACPHGSKVQVMFRWADLEGDAVRIHKEPWHSLNGRQSVIEARVTAPPEAHRLTVSIHSSGEDRISITDLALTLPVPRVLPWPGGKRAAVSISFDWETAMGGLVHTRSTDSIDLGRAEERAMRMRRGTAILLDLLVALGIRGTWFANGYNFLLGNEKGASLTLDPVFSWAREENGWNSRWSEIRWFEHDPMGTFETHPAWYFGDLIPRLQQTQQAIETHTFSHLYGGLATPLDWRRDLIAWNEVAAPHGVGPASVLAFPWGGSDGMTDGNWKELVNAGITVVTRTSHHPRSRIANLDRNVLQVLRGFDSIVVFPDAYLTAQTVSGTEAQLERAIANQGAVDIWAHPAEVTSPREAEAWRSMLSSLRARNDVWIAPIRQIAEWWRDIKRVDVALNETGDRSFRLKIKNAARHDLTGIAVRLPFRIREVVWDERSGGHVDGARGLLIDLEAGETAVAEVWPES
jgi:hypothetical protein